MAAVIDNALAGRFELVEHGQTAFALYRLAEGQLILPHVEAPPALRGAGTAGRLMEGVLTQARERGLKVVPLCGYAAAYIRRHAEWRDLLA